jgi:hypothetical protein
MENLALGLFVSFVITWSIGMLPPVLIRFVFLKRPMNKWPAIGVCTLFFFVNLILFMSLGSKSKTHAAVMLMAFVSFYILRKQSAPPKSPDIDSQ